MVNDNKKTSVTQTSMFGLLVGLSFIAVSLFFYKSGENLHFNPQLNNVITLLSIAGIFVGIRKYREENLNGIISYGKALGACMYLISVASLIYGIYIYFMYYYTTELQANYIEMIQLAWATVYSDSALLESMKTLAEVSVGAGVIAFSEVIKNIFTGFLFSLFLAGILKKKEEEVKKVEV